MTDEALKAVRQFSARYHRRIDGPLGEELRCAESDPDDDVSSGSEEQAGIWGVQLTTRGTILDDLSTALEVTPADRRDVLALILRRKPFVPAESHVYDKIAAEHGFRPHSRLPTLFTRESNAAQSAWRLLAYEREKPDLLAGAKLSVLGGHDSPLYMKLRACGDQPIWVWGTGLNGRLLVQRLRAIGVEPVGFIANCHGTAQHQVECLPVRLAADARDARAASSTVVIASKDIACILRRIQMDGDWHCRLVAAPPPGTSGPFLAKPARERIQWVERLAEQEMTDIERWQDTRNLASAWGGRSMLVASMIAPGAHVLDIGAGAQTLKTLLPTSCRYTPSDVVARTSDTIVVDLNRQEFPPGLYDVITALGVLEYIYRVGPLLERARAAAPAAIISYPAARGRRRSEWLQSGAVNHFDIRELVHLVEASGWRVDRSHLYERVGGREWLLALHSQ
jgi:hypothetical protein